MSKRWRPSFEPEYEEKIEEFLERHEEIPINDAREFLRFSANKLITEMETSDRQIEEAQEQLKKLQDKLEK